MKKESVVISIIMATWNRAHLISETLDSISSQTHLNWECLIIDDGSKDDTARLVKQFTSSDSRFTYLRRTEKYKKGLPGCRNQGLDLANGEFVIFFDDDDIIHPENLQTCLDLLKDGKFSFCRYDKKPFFDNSKKIAFQAIHEPFPGLFKIDDLDKMITGEIPFASCCVLWSKKCFELERFNEGLMYAEEWECYSRILSKNLTGVSIKEILYFNRKHRNSNTGDFWNNNPVSVASKIQAAKLVVETLASEKLFNSKLEKFFIRMSFSLKSNSLLDKTLSHSNLSAFNKFKYKLGYLIYPILRPLFILKGKLQAA